MSGILAVAEVPAFLANADQFYAQADEENQEWRAFARRVRVSGRAPAGFGVPTESGWAMF